MKGDALMLEEAKGHEIVPLRYIFLPRVYHSIKIIRWLPCVEENWTDIVPNEGKYDDDGDLERVMDKL